MSVSVLRLYAESEWVSPWVFHAMIALEEKRLPYDVEAVTLPVTGPLREQLLTRALVAKVPALVHGEVWVTESLAISEYLAETFSSANGYPKLFPTDLAQRARARQLMSMLRTGFFALREARPTTSVFRRKVSTVLEGKAKAEADELLRLASVLLTPGKKHLFDHWCIADADFSLMLMRLVANEDPMPAHVAEYAAAQWQRPSVRKFLSYIPTMK